MAWAAGNLINRLGPSSVTWNSITFARVLSVDDSFAPMFNQTRAGGSLTNYSAVRGVDGEVTITYQGSRATTIPNGGTVASLVANFLDQDGNTVATTYPFMMAAGPAFQMPNADFGTYVQKFIQNAPIATEQSALLPTTA